ncbi:MAG: hypothetical protein HUJ68_08105 [Clostridia bacterium]|nr:hypothetical protein [Clostridia bacterium]
MKKLFFIFLGFSMVSCKLNKSFKKDLKYHKDEVIFSLNCSDFLHCPVVTIEDSGVILYFLVDTGCTISRINVNGFKKFNLETDQNLEDLTFNLFLEDKRYLSDGKNHNLSMTIKNNKVFNETQIDGILGIDFLSQYDNVVFDYKTNKIKFNEPPINNNPIEMFKKRGNGYYVYYSLDGIKDFGLIDTGCDGFVVREKYQTDYIETTENEIEKFIEESDYIKKKSDTVMFNTIKIGNVFFDNIEGYFAIDERIKMSQDATKEHRLRSILGYKFFKNHIIQLDFKNNVFYIE